MRGSTILQAGALVRGQAKRRLRDAAFERGIDIDIGEDKGFFESSLRITVKHDDEDHLQSFLDDISRWVKELGR